jgi:glucokinase
MSNNEQIAAVGLDVGGTKISAGVVLWPSGEVRFRQSASTRPERGGEAVLSSALALAAASREQAIAQGWKVTGVGLGVAELVDAEGNVTSGQTIRWQGLPVRLRLSAIAPAAVESDVRAGALAESMFGAARGCESFVYVTVGTGISSCLVQRGRVFAGHRGNALVMASSPLSTICTHCGATLHPVLEDFASGPAIAARYKLLRPTAAACVRAEDVFRAAEYDAGAAGVLRSAGESLGVSVAFLVNVLDPELVVVGGGLYWRAFESSAREHIWSKDTRDLPILPAALGVDAGLVGAAAVVFQKAGAA